MRSVTRLITQVRRQTENDEVSDFTGISDEEFIQYLNDAQYNLQAAIVHQHPRVFVQEAVINAVAGQERYALPEDCFLRNKVHNVDFSSTGAEDDYFALEEDTIKRRSSGITGTPSKYIRLSGQILLTPQPQSGGKIRINYVHSLRELHKASAKTSAEKVIDSVNNFTINLDNNNFTTDLGLLSDDPHICIIDKNGSNLVSGIHVVSVTNDAIVCEKHTIKDGEVSTIPAGSIIVPGLNSTTHSELDVSVERYLLAYCAWKILKRDSSIDSSEAMQELQLMQQEIVQSYAMISDDIQYIPQLNSWDDWSV
jgi:hypothetical protein